MTRIGSPWAIAFGGAIVAVMTFALDHQYDEDVLSSDWWFRMVEYASVMAWAYIAIFSGVTWVRRQLGRMLPKRQTPARA